MKDYPIKGFWSKLMVASRSINNIPDEYLDYAQNVRIYDWGIGPRPGKQILTNSWIWTKNMWGFVMNNVMYQITNWNIYSVDTTTWVQTLKASLWYDAFTDIEVYGKNIAIIVSPGQTPKWYDGNVTVTNITTVPASTTGIVEYCRNFSFITKDNILYISRPITAANPEYSYDWTGAGAQNITYDSNIIGLKWTMNGLYVFLENKIEFLWANALQNVSWSATFISTPLWEGAAPISNACIAASWDKIFYISRNLQIQTVNVVAGATNPSIGELSARPVVGIREFLTQISTTQTTAFAYYNENYKIIEFHFRSIGNAFNDKALIYDLINDTWSVDTGKNYNYIVKYGYDYYGFSDINSSIYKNDTWNSDNWTPIDLLIRTSGYNIWTILHKMFGWFYIAWSISFLTDLSINITIDGESVFQDVISWKNFAELQPWQDESWVVITDEVWNIVYDESHTVYRDPSVFEWEWELSWMALSDEPIAWDLYFSPGRTVFDRIADEGRIYQSWKRIAIEVTSWSQIQDFILDMLWFRYLPSTYTDVTDKF